MLAQIVLILAALLILSGLIMVLLDAFSEGVFWGLLILLVPPFAPVYCFIKWRKDQARNGFAMTLVGVTMVGVGLYGGGIHSIPGISDQVIVKKFPTALPDNEPLPNEELAAKIDLGGEGEYDPILNDDKAKFSANEIAALPPKEDKSVRGTGRAKIRRSPLVAEDLDSVVGSIIEVTFINSQVKRGKLIAYTDESLSLEEQIGGGYVSFEHNFKKISSMVLLVDPDAASPPPVVKKKDNISVTDTEVRVFANESANTSQAKLEKSNEPTEKKELVYPEVPEELTSSE